MSLINCRMVMSSLAAIWATMAYGIELYGML